MNNFVLRKVTRNELPQQLNLIKLAKQVLKERNIPQWQVGPYPELKDLENDFQMDQGFGYFSGETLVATAAVSSEADVLYDDQRFTKNARYLIIHRFAVNPNFSGMGIGTQFLEAIIAQAKKDGFYDLRIDTHPRNFAMQKTILRAGFHSVGDLILPEIVDPERIVYQITTN